MGKVLFHRQRIRLESAAIKVKSLLVFLTSMIRARREVSLEEAELIALDALQYLKTFFGMRHPGQFEMPIVLDQP